MDDLAPKLKFLVFKLQNSNECQEGQESQGDLLMKVIKNLVNEQISVTRTWGKK